MAQVDNDPEVLVVRLLQSAGALQRKLEDEEMLMNEVQRDKERFDQRRGIEEKVRPVLVGFEYLRVLPLCLAS